MKEILDSQDIGTDNEQPGTIEEIKQEVGLDYKADADVIDDKESDAAESEEIKESDAAASEEFEEFGIAEAEDTEVADGVDEDSAEKETTYEAASDNKSDAEAVSEGATEESTESADEESNGPLDRVWKAIRMYRRDEVSALIREHAIDIATDEQKIEIGKGIMGLRDIKLVEQFAKEQHVFTPDMLRLDFENWNNRDFVRQVLSRCKKNFDLSDETVCHELFEISCEVGQTEVLSFLVNKKKAADCYPMLASGTEEAFAVLKQVKPASLDADTRVKIMYAAAITTQGQDRLEKLSSFGYDLFEENSDEKSLSDLLSERIVSNTYTKNRAGDMNRIKDKAVLQFIERKKNPVDPKAGRKKFNLKKALPFLILGLIFICVLVYAIMYQIFS